MRHWLCAMIATTLAVPAAASGAATTDRIAEDYVVLMLGASQLSPDMIAINEPRPEELAAAKAAKLDAVGIAAHAGDLIDRLGRLAVPADRIEAMRIRHLRAMLRSLRLQMQTGARPTVEQEVRVQFGVTQPFKPLASYDAAIDRLDRAMPGPGTLADRIASLRSATIVPPDRVEVVFNAALAECRKRTVAHLKLPAESVEVRFTDDATFPGGNTYVGGGKSVTEISRKIPAELDRLLVLACHEVYPGHHVHFVTQSEQLYRKRGWVEFAVELNGGPIIPVAEAVAEFGVGLTFPVEDRIAFERDTLFPLAGLTMIRVGDWRAYFAARSSILGASSTVARDFLNKKIDRDTAYRLFLRYRLQSPDAAGQLLKILPVVGSYVIASDLGWYTIDRMMKGKSIAEQWRLFAKIEREPMLLEDVAALR